jgi:hypothetical protein
MASATGNGWSYLGWNTIQVVSADNQTYAINGFANRLSALEGEFRFHTAPSGTAGGTITFTQAMTLDASGNLLVGATASPSTPVATNRYMRLGVSAIEEGSSEITITSTPQNITRQSGVGGSATITYYNQSGGAQQTDIVAWTGAAAVVVGSAGTSGLTITYGVNTGALTMATASGSAGAYVKAFTV